MIDLKFQEKNSNESLNLDHFIHYRNMKRKKKNKQFIFRFL